MVKSRRYNKRRPNKRGRSRKGNGQMRLQAGGQPAFVGASWNGADTNTWGTTNHYAYNPQGSGSGDPLDLMLSTRNVKPGIMMGGKKRRHSNKKRGRTNKKRRNKKSTMKRRRKRKTYRGGELMDDLNGPGNYLRNQLDRSLAGGRKRRRKTNKNKKRKPRKKTGKRRNKKRQRGGYKGDAPFQNALNLVRGAGNSLGNVVHGFRGYPEVASPYPTDQPGMIPPKVPVPIPADIETLYKDAQTYVGSIGTE